jgi:hypothetical protein
MQEFEIYNPLNKTIEDLPFIYGFNNGGNFGMMYAQLITQDGFGAGSHLCSSEAYMPSDLGCVKGSRPDRHEAFKKEYPEGYRMEFVYSDDIDSHKGLQKAFMLANNHAEQSKNIEGASDTKVEITFSEP